MHFTSAITVAITATAAAATPRSTCSSGGYFAGKDNEDCFVIKCDKGINGTPYEFTGGKSIYDCTEKCAKDVNCLEATFDKKTGVCDFYDGNFRSYSDLAYDKAHYSASHGPCIGA